MRDEHYTPFKGSPPSDQPRLAAVRVFVLARRRGARTDAMRGSLPRGGTVLGTKRGSPYDHPDGVEEVRTTFNDLGIDALMRGDHPRA